MEGFFTRLGNSPLGNWIDKLVQLEETQMTNAIKIRAMSDEELAEWLADTVGCKGCDRIGLCRGNSECKESYLQWLKSEAKE